MKVFQTSLSAAVIILLVVIIRALAINRLPKKTFVILWNIVLCRLFIPFNIPLSLSVFGTFNSSEKALDQTKNIIKIVPGTTIHRITNSKSVLTGITDGGLEASSTPTAVLSFVQDKS
ncbi:MAG: hypothetical protein GX094_07310, partial [Clostridiales bacterium]|nr:hypothetical protein [Clostridiales bacterium]